jgi:hypothetical protein
VTDGRDATSILVWNGRVSRTRPTPTREPRSPAQDGEHEHDEGDREDCRGEAVKRRGTDDDDEKPSFPGQWSPVRDPGFHRPFD